PHGPMLLYVTPAWPRPMVAEGDSLADLKALAKLEGGQVFGTEATAAELRRWWKERGLAEPPLALRPAAGQRLGVRHLPLAIVVDAQGRVAWVKEGYTAGDEAEWSRQLKQASSRE